MTDKRTYKPKIDNIKKLEIYLKRNKEVKLISDKISKISNKKNER